MSDQCWNMAHINSHSILLLEDDDQFASILQEFLELYSCKVTRVKDGVEGLRRIVTADFDLTQFRQETEERLPEYARPVFVRILTAIEMTGTHKPKKQQLAIQGYDRNAKHFMIEPALVVNYAA